MENADFEALRHYCDTSLDEHLQARPAHGLEGALALFRRAARDVPAYGAWLSQHGVDAASVTSADTFSSVPVITKDTYLRTAELSALSLESDPRTVAVSSGSTGLPTYFPRSFRHEIAVCWRFEQVFRDTFLAHERRTLAVVCFPLGTWVGGMFTVACCRWLAMKGYPLMVVTAGNQPEEIWRALRELGPSYDQVVLLGYPPFLKNVIDGGTGHGVTWDAVPVRLVLAGEVVSEAWRDITFARTGARGDIERFAASLYGTADAGVLGAESVICTAIRRFAASRPDLCEALFGERRLPTLVQYDPADRYFEVQGDRLVFTGEGGSIPLVRYAIGDTGGVHSFEEMIALLNEHGFSLPDTEIRELPFVFVFGRSQHAVSFYGANVFVEIMRLGLEAEDVREHVTGKLVMETVEDADGDAHLVVDVELARGAEVPANFAARVADEMTKALRAASPEFAAYVPTERQRPEVTCFEHGDPERFPIGVKHRYTR